MTPPRSVIGGKGARFILGEALLPKKRNEALKVSGEGQMSLWRSEPLPNRRKKNNHSHCGRGACGLRMGCGLRKKVLNTIKP